MSWLRTSRPGACALALSPRTRTRTRTWARVRATDEISAPNKATEEGTANPHHDSSQFVVPSRSKATPVGSFGREVPSKERRCPARMASVRLIGLFGSVAMALILTACSGTQTPPLPAQKPLPGVKNSPNFVLVNQTGSNFEIESASTGRVVKALGAIAGYTDNGLALSPDGQDVYLTANVHQSLMIERIAVANSMVTPIAQGEQPAVSPNGRLLAYGGGTVGSGLLVVRDLTSGAVRSINLSRLLGAQTDLLNASITWLGDSSEIVVLPGEVGNDLMGNATTAPLPGSCSAVPDSDTCLIMVNVGSRKSLTADRIVLNDLRPPQILTGDSFSHGLLLADFEARHTVVYKADVADTGGSFVRLFSLPPVLPLAFDTRGSELLYLVGHGPIALWIGEVTQHGLENARLLNSAVTLAGLAW